jgi:hypothetical protein
VIRAHGHNELDHTLASGIRIMVGNMKHLTAILRMVDRQMDLSTHKGIISGCEVEMVISNV